MTPAAVEGGRGFCRFGLLASFQYCVVNLSEMPSGVLNQCQEDIAQVDPDEIRGGRGDPHRFPMHVGAALEKDGKLFVTVEKARDCLWIRSKVRRLEQGSCRQFESCIDRPSKQTSGQSRRPGALPGRFGRLDCRFKFLQIEPIHDGHMIEDGGDAPLSTRPGRRQHRHVDSGDNITRGLLLVGQSLPAIRIEGCLFRKAFAYEHGKFNMRSTVIKLPPIT